MATRALAGPTAARTCWASCCVREVDRGAQRLAGGRLGLEQGASLVPVVHRRDGGSAGAEELLVVPLLQAGDADLVAGPDASVAVLDQLCRRRSDGAEHRGGEVLGGGQGQLVGDHSGSGDPADRGEHGLRGLVTPVDDGLNEGLGAGGDGLLGERGGIDVDQLRQRGRRPRDRCGSQLELVDPDPDHRPRRDDRLVAGSEDGAALRAGRGLVEPLACLQGGFHDRRGPPHQPALTVGRLALAQLDGGLVGPGLRAHLPAPVERAGGGVAVAGDLPHRDLRVAETPGDGGVLLARGRVVDEVDTLHVACGQSGGQAIDGVLGIRAGSGKAAGNDPEQQDAPGGHGLE